MAPQLPPGNQNGGQMEPKEPKKDQLNNVPEEKTKDLSKSNPGEIKKDDNKQEVKPAEKTDKPVEPKKEEKPAEKPAEPEKPKMKYNYDATKLTNDFKKLYTWQNNVGYLNSWILEKTFGLSKYNPTDILNNGLKIEADTHEKMINAFVEYANSVTGFKYDLSNPMHRALLNHDFENIYSKALQMLDHYGKNLSYNTASQLITDSVQAPVQYSAQGIQLGMISDLKQVKAQEKDPMKVAENILNAYGLQGKVSYTQEDIAMKGIDGLVQEIYQNMATNINKELSKKYF
ncbi:MAG: hypothetical protein QXS41_00535 [Candidatus Woesearchaeota archaeon]